MAARALPPLLAPEVPAPVSYTHLVVPRIPAGEIPAKKLGVIAEVAEEFGLYVKITGAQRIGMFGARLEQLPYIWERLVDAGFESGQAYGKSLRNVKSCMGSTWCLSLIHISCAPRTTPPASSRAPWKSRWRP